MKKTKKTKMVKKEKGTAKKHLVTYDAIKVIQQDSKQFTVETGGILIGTLGNPITIVAAGVSGENSQHHATSFTSDSQADRECLATARRKYGNGVGVVGWWHKHPSGFESPSQGDCRQVQFLMDEYNDGKPVLMGIVNKSSGIAGSKFSLRLFSLDSNGQPLEHPWKRVSGSNKELLKAVREAPQKPETQNIEFWKNPDFQFYLNPIGRDRIVREVRALKQAGWSVTTTRRKSDRVMLLDLTKGSIQLCLEFPPEFPLNPPAVLTCGRRLVDLEILQEWNSLCRLTELAEYAEGIVNSKHCSKRDQLMPTIF